VEVTGARRIVQHSGSSQDRLLLWIMLGTAALSAFISSTGTVAMMLPIVVAAAWGMKRVPSKFLLPVAIMANVAGILTLISAPTNIIVSDTLADAGQQPFGFFEFTIVGLPLVAVTVVYILFFGKHLLPEYQPSKRPVDLEATVGELSATYSLEGSIFWLSVLPGSDFVGQTLGQANIAADSGVIVLHIEAHQPDIERGDRIQQIGAALQEILQPKASEPPALPNPETYLEAGAMLLVKGEQAAVQRLSVQHKLGIEPIAERDGSVVDRLLTRELGFAEVVIPPRSRYEDRAVAETEFARRYDLQVVSATRQNEIIDHQAKSLRVGDTLLVRGTWAAIGKLRNDPDNFVVVGQPEAISGQIVGLGRQAYLALAVVAGMVVLMLTGVVPTVMAAFLAAVAMVLLDIVTMPQAYRSINWSVIVLIAALIPVGIALEKTGAVDFMADMLVDTLGALGPLALLAGTFLLASGFSQVINNVVATILISPVAYQAAISMEVSPYPFMMMVAVGVITGFLTPIAGAPVMIVMNPGGYEFKDYAKVGFPLLILIFIVSMILVPLVWPL
jgi:di/tricarboxylate transporter